ncbi:hypothetical protein KSP35_15810 [Aquihabitans sp. G128]|uniref:hypothetical protein n=1 Tax=Aquihabitans sp. G128 TaxID=2849779 RepID=UPI001C22571D|nr:hypothetical protein [Aquihabitans sp. G128]QXC59833.1 hypothetical protein KSP35_15810 [Aquihabitans sp. G128]
MTDPLAPLTDEDLSAVLDGEAPADVIARAEADPAARARLAELRTASAAVRAASVPALSPTVIDDLVGRALAAADEVPAAPGDQPGDGEPDAVVAPLRPPTRSGSRGVPRWLVAAAIVVLVGLGLVLVWSGRDDTGSSGDTAAKITADQSAEGASTGTDANSSADAPTDGAAPEATVGDAPHGSPTTTTAPGSQSAASDLADLGTFATTAELRADLKTAFPTSAPAFEADADSGDQAARSVTNASVDRCDDLARQIFEISSGPVRRGVATVDGEVLYVYEYPYTSDSAPSATRLVVAAGQDSCNVALSFVR